MQLPHELDRSHQLKTAQRILQSDKKFIIVCAPTGSGKTAYVAYAASKGYRVLANVKTKSLQRQYESNYDFTPLFGKGNYKCLQFAQQQELFGINPIKPTADLCDSDEIDYVRCKRNCPYPIARQDFIYSQAGVLNYSKFLLDYPVVQKFSPDIIFLDEAHELADGIVTGFSGTELKWTKRLLKYTDKIFIKFDEKLPYPIAQREARDKAVDWLEQLDSSLSSRPPRHPKRGGDPFLWKWHKRRREEIDITLAAIETNPECWYIDSDNYRFLIKPLTSQFHFRKLFDKADKIVLMSATIQKDDIESLGLKPGEYEYIKVPNVIPSAMRPVYDLKTPKITKKTPLSEKKIHAKLIAKVFDNKPDWNGIVHTTSYDMSCELADLMKLPNPIFISERSSDSGKGTDEQYQEWCEFDGRYESAICISHQFHTGVDMGDVAINICARVPYPYFGDAYERNRFDYNPGQARVRVANVLEQQMGRNRRGFDEHYGPDAKKYNAIADGKWSRLKSAFQTEFLQSIL